MGVDYWRQTLLKKDLENTANYATWFRESHYPGEVFFIPNPEGVEEDEDSGPEPQRVLGRKEAAIAPSPSRGASSSRTFP